MAKVVLPDALSPAMAMMVAGCFTPVEIVALIGRHLLLFDPSISDYSASNPTRFDVDKIKFAPIVVSERRTK